MKGIMEEGTRLAYAISCTSAVYGMHVDLFLFNQVDRLEAPAKLGCDLFALALMNSYI